MAEHTDIHQAFPGKPESAGDLVYLIAFEKYHITARHRQRADPAGTSTAWIRITAHNIKRSGHGVEVAARRKLHRFLDRE
jgi:hypothetical protein